MRTKLLLGLALVLCGGLTGYTTEIRVRNDSTIDFKNVVVGGKNYGDIKRGAATDYQTWEKAYRYSLVSLLADSKPLKIQPEDYVGESQLGDGQFAYVLTIQDGRLDIRAEEDKLYVYYGFVGNDSAHRFLSTQIHLDEAVFVGSGDYLELKGQVERHGTNLVADLVGSTGQQSQFYQGNMTLEKPFFAQGGAASGGAGPQFWFVISTNWDCRTILKGVNAVIGLTNDPFNHPAAGLPPAGITNVPKQIDPATGLPAGNLIVDPTTGLPLPSKRDKQP
jgi:hypothetical protein